MHILGIDVFFSLSSKKRTNRKLFCKQTAKEMTHLFKLAQDLLRWITNMRLMLMLHCHFGFQFRFQNCPQNWPGQKLHWYKSVKAHPGFSEPHDNYCLMSYSLMRCDMHCIITSCSSSTLYSVNLLKGGIGVRQQISTLKKRSTGMEWFVKSSPKSLPARKTHHHHHPHHHRHHQWVRWSSLLLWVISEDRGNKEKHKPLLWPYP